ncbi:DUF4124 domain-containing protein [Litoribrevibacter albus]|uniref:DUF4124 domain-containing protein n=1 Tax=Litoribrevibacter albus TaxID=1473156 RepID=A0AA37W5L8_9GAMM|nr:DUF4124 domain-containing protein [Litoribrevibacter albus]GLQ30655.1 hypothetical protein GCM10007876_11330 [Litoribrevibacter albus]
MKSLKQLKFALIISGLTALTSFSVADTFYKWVDENGTTHYGSQPSGKHDSTTIHTSGKASGPNSRMAPSQKSEKQNPEAAGEGTVAYDAEEMAKYCNDIKKRHDLMVSKNQIKQRNKDGSVVMLTEEQRQQQISDLKKKMAENCK